MKSSLIPHAFHIGSPRCRPTERRWIVSWMNIERAQRSKARERRVFLFLQPMSWRVMSVWNCVYTIFSVVCYLLSLIHTDGSLFFVAQTDVALRFALLAASGSRFHFSNEWENLCIEARKTLEMRGMNEYKRRLRRYVVIGTTGPMSCELDSHSCRISAAFSSSLKWKCGKFTRDSI